MKKEDLKLLFKDYESYLVEKKDFFFDLQKNDNILYLKITDLLTGLKDIFAKYSADEVLTEADITLFEIGLEYLYDYVLTISSHTKENIENRAYIIELLIDLDDFINEAEDELKDGNETEIYETLEKYLTNSEELDETLYHNITKYLDNEDYISILDIFYQYVEENNLV